MPVEAPVTAATFPYKYIMYSLANYPSSRPTMEQLVSVAKLDHLDENISKHMAVSADVCDASAGPTASCRIRSWMLSHSGNVGRLSGDSMAKSP